jgi:uncharacterized protein YukE
VHADLAKIVDGITERDVRRLFTEYGQAAFPSREADRVELRELRALVQLQESIDRLAEGLDPLRSGPQRDKDTQAIREKRMLLNDMLKARARASVASPEKLATYQEARANNLKHQIEDLEKQIATGERPQHVPPPEPSPEVKRLTEQRDALRRRIQEIDAQNKGPPKETAQQRYLRQREESLAAQIDALTKRVAGESAAAKDDTPKPTTPELERLKAALDGLRKQLRAIERPPATPEARAKAARLSQLRQQIKVLEERIATGKKSATGPRQDVPDAETQALIDQRDALRAKIKAAEEAANPPLTEEQQYQRTRAKGLHRLLRDVQARIAAGDFALRVRPPPRDLDAANKEAKYKLDQAKMEFARWQFEMEMRKRPLLKRIFDVTVVQPLNLARASLIGLDLAAVLRQGGFIVLGHPIRGVKAMVPMFRAMVSEVQAHAIEDAIHNRPNADLYEKAKLELTKRSSFKQSEIEEQYQSRWLEKLPWWTVAGPIMRGSQRAFTTFLNVLRADTFDAMAAGLSLRRKPTLDEAKIIANYVNVATGRGKIGTKGTTGTGLNTVFFAPRLVASRFNLLAGQPMYGGTARTRAYIAAEYARFLMGTAAAIALLMWGLSDDDDKATLELDPRSSDFGKVKIGNTRIDPLAGLAQVTVFLSRVATGVTITSKGEMKPLRNAYRLFDDGTRTWHGYRLKYREVAYGDDTTYDVLTRFLRTKLAPFPGTMVNLAVGENVVGEPVGPDDAALSLVTPLSVQNVADVMEEHGMPKGSAITMLELLGMSVSHYDAHAKRKE